MCADHGVMTYVLIMGDGSNYADAAMPTGYVLPLVMGAILPWGCLPSELVLKNYTGLGPYLVYLPTVTASPPLLPSFKI